ncbi:MAG TPA: type II toxin-antitoxin system ParD family antitoxin [Allosphingosinicella sp.]|nr:type II toxin-antitoxin system ParD family antitoxin [Allosphingosinicella sp.]
MNEQSDIRLARHFRVFIEDQVAQRKFNHATEVIEEALRLLELRDAREGALRRALQEGLDSGDAGPLDMNEIKRLGRERASRTDA